MIIYQNINNNRSFLFFPLSLTRIFQLFSEPIYYLLIALTLLLNIINQFFYYSRTQTATDPYSQIHLDESLFYELNSGTLHEGAVEK